MRYVNPLVEGSSPSPVTEAKTTENSQKTLRNEGFLMRTRSEVPSAVQCSEMHENEPESNSRATAGATGMREGNQPPPAEPVV